jgi:hypothetical protein
VLRRHADLFSCPLKPCEKVVRAFQAWVGVGVVSENTYFQRNELSPHPPHSDLGLVDLIKLLLDPASPSYLPG